MTARIAVEEILVSDEFVSVVKGKIRSVLIVLINLILGDLTLPFLRASNYRNRKVSFIGMDGLFLLS